MANAIAKNVLDYWFGKTRPISADESALKMKTWFSSNADADYDIERRFGKLVSTARKGAFNSWENNHEDCLALILLLDQFPRNLHRGQSSAFSSDSKALELGSLLLGSGGLSSLGCSEQAFALMPFQHAENLDVQNQGVEAYGNLALSVPEEWKSMAEGYLNSAKQHRDIIAKFGRFPHRNNIFDRESSEAEIRYMAEGGSSFGQ